MARHERILYFIPPNTQLRKGQALHWESHRELVRLDGQTYSFGKIHDVLEETAKALRVKMPKTCGYEAPLGVATTVMTVYVREPRTFSMEFVRRLQTD